ncbi:MAG: DUF819 family protein [Bacteroidales bacterium]|nr:DUF819 family protein [Bacteroidales bacterium]
MNVYIITIVYLLFPAIIISLFKRYTVAQKIGTVIMAYAVGIIMALAGWIPTGDAQGAEKLQSIQKMLMNVTVPLAIPLMLFNSDFKLWTKSLPKTIIALIAGLVSIVVAIIIGYFVFRNAEIDEFSKIGALMTSIYTGGTMNFYAIGSALNVKADTIILAYTFEVIVTFPFILFLTAGGFKLFRKILPFPDESVTIDESNIDISSNTFENYDGMLSKKHFPGMMVGLLISLGFLAIGAGLSLLITGGLNELVIILTITTLGIIASFNDKIRNLPKTFELGMFFILIFSIIVASQFDIYSLTGKSMTICWFILFIMLSAIIIHLILCKLFKVSGDLFTVAIVGMLCSPPFIPPIVGAMNNRKVLISGIVIGLAGYAVGTYLGLLLSVVLPVL